MRQFSPFYLRIHPTRSYHSYNTYHQCRYQDLLFWCAFKHYIEFSRLKLSIKSIDFKQVKSEEMSFIRWEIGMKAENRKEWKYRYRSFHLKRLKNSILYLKLIAEIQESEMLKVLTILLIRVLGSLYAANWFNLFLLKRKGSKRTLDLQQCPWVFQCYENLQTWLRP